MNNQLENQADRRISQLEDDFVKADLEQMTQATKYMDYQYGMIECYLGKRILEVGSGIGSFTRRFLKIAELVVGIEPNRFCYAELLRILGNNKSLFLVNQRVEQCKIEELKTYLLDTIICINVLEHIENDYAALKDFNSILGYGGKIILIVPSHDWAFGVIDKAVGHHRRYSRKKLIGLVKKAGFNVQYTRYFNPLGLLGWLWNSKIAGIVKQSDRQIYIFNRYIVPLQRIIEKWITFPIGQSLLLVGKKGEQK